MQISAHTYEKKMYFEANTPFGVLKRSVCVYLVSGETGACLIDAGIYPHLPAILEFVSSDTDGRNAISEILISHAHSDHIGALKSLRQQYGCTVASSEHSRAWIEDIDAQFRERPVPRYYDFVEGSVPVGRILKEGDVIELGESTLVTYEIPGHDRGQLAYFHRQDGVLFTADSIPIPGEMPIYDDVMAQVNTLRHIRSIAGVQVLVSAWGETQWGQEAIERMLDEALAYVQRVHDLTLGGIEEYGEAETEAVAKHVHAGLGLHASEFTQLFKNTVQAHAAVKGRKDVLDQCRS